MKEISLWANQHRNNARFLVVIIKITLACMAYYAGNKLYHQQIHIPVTVILIAAFLSMTAAILYPSKKLLMFMKHQLYVKQKSCDFILAACTFIITLTVANNPGITKPSVISATYASFIKKHPPKAEEIISSLSYRDKSSLTRVEKRVLKKEFYKQLKIYAIAKITHNKEKADSAVPIILTIIVAMGLLVLLMGLVCSLSCSGADVAAGVVGVLGLTAIIWGSIIIIKSITKKSQENK